MCTTTAIVDLQAAGRHMPALDEAMERGLLQADTTGIPGHYALAHSLLRRVLYEELAPAQQRHLHAQIGAGLAEAASQGGPPNVAAIAHHYALSDDHRAAVRWLERAGDHAAGVHALAAAQAHYGKAHHLLAQGAALPTAAADGEPAVLAHLSEKLGNLLLLEGEYAAAQVYFARARMLVHDGEPRVESRPMEQ